MHKFLSHILCCFILLDVIVYGCSSKNKDAKTGTSAVVNKPIGAEVYVVKDTTLQEKLNVLGSLVANERVQIVSESARRLIKINFQEGSYVRKGQLLFKLDDAGLQAQLKKLYAQRKLIANDEQRTAALLKMEGVSRQEYERAAGSVESIDADIEYTKVEIAQTEIRAPFSGKTGIRKVSEGAFVTQNMPLVTLEDISLIKIEFAVPEKYANSVGLNQPVNFQVENSDQLYKATIKVIEPYVDQNTRSLFIRAIAGNGDKKLLPGSSATVEVALNQIPNTVMIPSKALIPSLEGNSVLTIEHGKAVKTNVEVGLRTNTSVQITKGLQPGDSVMTTNILRAKPGVSIQAVVSE